MPVTREPGSSRSPYEGPLWWEDDPNGTGGRRGRKGLSRTARRGLRRVRRGMTTSVILAVIAVGGAAVLVKTPVGDFVMAGGGTRVVADTFQRTVANGWGGAEEGGKYTLSDPARASVANGTGKLALPSPGASTTSRLTGVAAADVETRLTFGIPANPATGSVYVGALLRAGAKGAYRAKVRVMPGGAVRLSFSRADGGGETFLGGETELPLRLAPDKRLVFAASVSGTDKVTLGAKAWLDGVTAPGNWQHTATDASAQRISGEGHLGLWTYLSRSTDKSAVLVNGWTAEDTTVVPEPPIVVSASPKPTATEPKATPTPTPTTTSVKPSPTATSTTTAPSPGTGTGTSTGRPALKAGSAAVGSTSYAVPANAVVVASNGDDAAAGKLDAPVRTLARAVALAPTGGTVVLRGGVYTETLRVPANKTLTVQSYPGEAVWLDGSVPVSGWRASGGTWVKDGWTAKFDHSPSYTKGAADGTAAAWQFLSKDHPLAAHPDQVYVDGTALRQVGSAAEVKAGTFYVDYAAGRLHVGTDPNGKQVRATALGEGAVLAAPGTVLRGVGLRRFATSVPDMGTVKVTGRDSTVENVVVDDSATTGVSALAPHVTIRKVTVRRAGMLGFHANYADDLQLLSVRAEDNNSERFNFSPVSGGIKVTRSRGVAIIDSVASNNRSKGIWLDESVYDTSVTGTDVQNNAHHGISWEISAKGLFADNRITGNGGDGIKINNSSGGDVWHNTITGNGRALNIVQDKRSGANKADPGHDPRQPFPDPTMTWLTGNLRIGNNILGAPTAPANCILCVEDYTHTRSAAQMNITSNGNLYYRTSATPAWLIVWSRGPGDPATFTALPPFRTTTAQELTSSAPSNPLPKTPSPTLTRDTAIPLPPTVATSLGIPPTPKPVGPLS